MRYYRLLVEQSKNATVELLCGKPRDQESSVHDPLSHVFMNCWRLFIEQPTNAAVEDAAQEAVVRLQKRILFSLENELRDSRSKMLRC